MRAQRARSSPALGQQRRELRLQRDATAGLLVRAGLGRGAEVLGFFPLALDLPVQRVGDLLDEALARLWRHRAPDLAAGRDGDGDDRRVELGQAHGAILPPEVVRVQPAHRRRLARALGVMSLAVQGGSKVRLTVGV